MTRLLPPACLVAFLAVVWWTSGRAGVAYLPFWVAAAAPGVPLALRVFGRHGVSWVAGAAFGYAVSCLVIWFVIQNDLATRSGLLVAWALECIVLVAAALAFRRPLTLPGWTRRDTAGLCATLLLVPLLMGFPYRNLGARDAAGQKYYRAYFTADFVWHAALTAELGRFAMPPRNPYLSREDLHYYWTYFLPPAAVTAVGPPAVRNVEPALKVNALCTATLLAGALYLFAWSAGGGAWPAALAVTLVVTAASAEGTVAIGDLMARGQPLAALRDINVDAISAWKYNGLRVDGVHRTWLYTPQHGLSATLGLLGLLPAAWFGAGAGLAAIATAALLLGGATLLNPFLGAAFSAIYGLSVLADALRTRLGLRRLAMHALAALPPLAAVTWGTWNAMAEGAGEALTLGWVGFARNAPVATLLLSLGPVLLPAVAGFLMARRLPAQPARVAAVGLVIGLTLFYLVVLSERSWVGFRAGQIMLAMLTLPLARLFADLVTRQQRAAAAALAVLILAVGAPTVVADTFNASDIANLKAGPGFPWTLTVSPAQQEALDWVRRATPPRAIVQMDPVVRGRGHWSFIPTFAGRRMAAGLPISLLPQPAYTDVSQEVQRIYRAATAEDAHAIARRLGIDYLWVDENEKRAYPEGVARLDAAPTLFPPVFRNDEVTVYAVH
jgi:hypothetical protein